MKRVDQMALQTQDSGLQIYGRARLDITGTYTAQENGWSDSMELRLVIGLACRKLSEAYGNGT